MTAPTITNGVYFLQNIRTRTVIDLHRGSSSFSILPTNATIIPRLVLGFVKHELDDIWASVQLWIITRIGNTEEYTIQKSNSRTYLDLKGKNGGHATPVICHHQTGRQSQRWVVKCNSKKMAYAGSDNNTPIKTSVGSSHNTDNENQLWHIVRA
ncbi:ricin B-like lectin [Dichomitus squalens]|uniref:Ricin B-like lectin n=1 Tax=Dichomitus squalens TaxID=114155 RepID=A0A4Q9M813_9APHY|nr:ricin B-like lectin [Dichomitus squalens]